MTRPAINHWAELDFTFETIVKHVLFNFIFRSDFHRAEMYLWHWPDKYIHIIKQGSNKLLKIWIHNNINTNIIYNLDVKT